MRSGQRSVPQGCEGEAPSGREGGVPLRREGGAPSGRDLRILARAEQAQVVRKVAVFDTHFHADDLFFLFFLSSALP